MKSPIILTIAGALIIAFGIVSWPAVAALNSVSGLFESGEYDEATNILGSTEENARDGEQVLWRSRLTTDPKVAVSMLEASVTDEKMPDSIRIRMALELADIHAGLGQHSKVLSELIPIIESEITPIPGIVYLRAGLSLRVIGRLQQAREMLASVKPGDPQFVLARYYLGDIGLEEKDITLALRYFEAAAKATDEDGAGRLAAGRWRALMAHDQADDAKELAAKLAQSDPGALALLEIGQLRQMEADEQRARASAEPQSGQTVTKTPDMTGRYALQIGAFSDRGLALEFVKRYGNQLPDLRIDKVRDDRGQFLYKVRAGDYVNPAMARNEAKQWAKRLDIEIIVADLSDPSQ
ncbi:MAG: tetratricopeptide (TPR) repeat protein [Candidatus Krumholzibacteriia bacterium]|jgi:tetratricopeptide (TPR) repeat protein